MVKKEIKHRNLQIVNGINAVIFHPSTLSVAMSWGISQKKAIYYEKMPTMAIQVSGLQHKGWVFISYDEGWDTYTVTLLDLNLNVLQSQEDIHFDELVTHIDDKVEKPRSFTKEEYREKLKAAALV